ncbi:MAG: 4-(cytidine 5'-diphospho)-2-C-methyl-D-erythritol kinase [Spirochaetales bacterium]|nr:4-(cytidine 5'-diphospho)-2-C-methyl-D-erythritol kinase [Spirochaetales bacterium]
MNKIKILAPAKINLHLQITSKRDDGFHNLISLFQMISLYDEITIEVSKYDNIILNGNFDCSVKDNLIFKAADWLKDTFNIKTGFIINCNKNIPQGAGLGGGSSDAAATLIGIKSLLGLNIHNERLLRGALELGSDVPFFLGFPTAIAEGRGEKLIPVITRDDLFLLITDTGINSSTKEVFGSLELDYDKINPLSADNISNAYLNMKPSLWPFLNTFSPYLYKKHSIYKNIIEILNKNGSEYSSITGTGSSVFGVFSDESLAGKAQKVLKDSNIMTHKVKMLANRPKPVYNYPTAE